MSAELWVARDEAEIEADARREWQHLTPWAYRLGQTFEADPYREQYIAAARDRRVTLTLSPAPAPDTRTREGE